jgi:histidine triad (HIT) family protein
MCNHEPENYNCPLCRFVKREDDEINKQEYIVYEDKNTLAFVSPKWWKNNPGHVIVISKQHIENIYDISDELIGDIYKTVKKLSIAVKKVYCCDGTSTRQHNEPAGNQDVWHFHVHVFPRYADDKLYENHAEKKWVGHEERIKFVTKLRDHFKNSEAY